ncbi:MAG: carbohydrate ABC transporter permease [Deltaproteobacteria bacterium]|jgi:alpha-glucoside transport system permease protein|nr:carbohydrate ABC transporter permease [Deltaproteobacteria bacterium]
MKKSSTKFHLLSGRLFTHLLLLFLVVAWTAPTLGLLVSSFRDKDQLTLSGWWSSFSSSEQSQFGRIGGSDDQIEQNKKYIITGSFFKEGESGKILWFGSNMRKPNEFKAGKTIPLKKGATFTVNTDGTYRWESPTPYKKKRGRRFFFVSEVQPRFTFDNYIEVMTSQGIGQSFINTFTVTIPATIIPIMIAAFAAYAFAWMRFPGRNLLFVVVVGLLVVPLQMALIPILRLYTGIGSYFDLPPKSYLGIWLAHTGFGLPLAIYLLRNYMSSLPSSLIESAKIDGASHFTVFTRIIAPLSIPALASFTIFQFLWVWNDLLVALVFLGKQDDQIVLTSRLRELLGSHGANWEILTAGAFVSIAVPLIVFFSLQRFFVRGLLSGSVKE